MKKVAIITGVNGQDGSYLSDLLLSKGYLVYGISRSGSSYNHHENFKVIRGDIRDSGLMWKIIHDIKPDEIYNLAAQGSPSLSFAVPEETVSGICTGTLGILEAIKSIDPTIRFYQASSSEMFGNNLNMPDTGFTESCAFYPSSPYACAKTFAHNLVQTYRVHHGLKASSGILFNHESPRRPSSFVTKKITSSVAKIKLGLQDKLYLGNIEAQRDWGFAGDYVNAMWLMLQQEEPEDYVICTGKTASVFNFLERVFFHAGLDDPYKYIEVDTALVRKNESKCVRGNPKKANEKLGWFPKYDVDKLAKLMYNHDYSLLKMEA
tara:strand:- start:7231 stop:8193 length:963 start_codon:yes stop_codon:yes gene_type:complete